jgi:hypothetical protein
MQEDMSCFSNLKTKLKSELSVMIIEVYWIVKTIFIVVEYIVSNYFMF